MNENFPDSDGTSGNNDQNNRESNEGKNFAVIAYITIFGLIIALILNNEKQYEFTRFHIRQMLGLSLTLLAAGMFNIIPVLGQLVFFGGMLAGLYMWICGLMNAVNGKAEPVPILGDKFQDWLKNL